MRFWVVVVCFALLHFLCSTGVTNSSVYTNKMLFPSALLHYEQ